MLVLGDPEVGDVQGGVRVLHRTDHSTAEP